MNVEKARHIYEISIEENIPEDIILAMEGIDPREYEEAIRLYFKALERTHQMFDFEDDEAYREFQEANYDEYFDWARTYRYCLYK